MKFNVGDTVRIADSNECMDDVRWVAEHIEDKTLAICYGVDSRPDDGDLGIVRYRMYDELVAWYYVQMEPCCGEDFPPCYIISEAGLQTTPPPIKVGDKVCLADPGKVYETYTEWVIKNVRDIEKIARFAYADHSAKYNTVYTVDTIAEHGHDSSTTLCYIRNSYNGAYLVVDTRGLELVK